MKEVKIFLSVQFHVDFKIILFFTFKITIVTIAITRAHNFFSCKITMHLLHMDGQMENLKQNINPHCF